MIARLWAFLSPGVMVMEGVDISVPNKLDYKGVNITFLVETGQKG